MELTSVTPVVTTAQHISIAAATTSQREQLLTCCLIVLTVCLADIRYVWCVSHVRSVVRSPRPFLGHSACCSCGLEACVQVTHQASGRQFPPSHCRHHPPPCTHVGEPAADGVGGTGQVLVCIYCYCYCYCYMVQDLPEHPVGSQRGSWGTSVIVRI
jgi:hypothetical protein